MERPCTFLFLFIVIIGWATAQEPVLFMDDFRDESQQWPWGITDTSQAYTERGNLRLIHSGGTELVFFTHEQYMDNEENFVISTQFTQRTSRFANSYGICWGASESANRYYAFEINPEGYFRIFLMDKGVEKELHPWTRFKKIQGAGKPNSIQIQREKLMISFWINEKFAAEVRFRNFRGSYHGLFIRKSGDLEVDYFQINHPPIYINLPEGSLRNAYKTPLDSTINSLTYHETAPQVTRDGRSLFFTRSFENEGLNSGDIWLSHYQGDTMWGEPTVLRKPFNNADRNAVAHIYRDNKSLLLTSKYKSDGSGNGQGLSITYLNRSRSWDVPMEIQVPDYENIARWGTWNLSPDKEILLMSMNKPRGGYGEHDIYVSFKENNGQWSSPKNLGPNINTVGTECTPYLAEDNETIYFSSTGMAGYGKADVYMSTRLSNTWTQWSEPVNLGPRINGPDWDAFYTPIPDRDEYAYMASIDTGKTDFDLYRVWIPEDVKLKPIARIHGRVLNIKTKQPVAAKVHCLDLSPDSTLQDFMNHPVTGSYSVFLPFGKAYELEAIKLGFYPITDTLDLRPIRAYREVERDIYVHPIEIGETIQLANVFFKRAKAELLPTSFPELDRLVFLMRSIPTLRIEIRGHTDNIGEDFELLKLSEERAELVKRYLIDHGVSPYRTLSRGFGSSLPIASNVDPETRRLNRRVEFRVLER